ncbi:glycerol-3-phosphate 1-O-acyltransferase PlsY [Peptostreptococcus porci]|uniref:glycerol-3-phosphate 1-O-acyltransferase PlsY n=1 Tax=Peptostreptococcus porci TaxID=2652282 RepID=UPI0023F1C263|nr:glycerol-3-phosphate 1-O-acyltransferase PlsY [Peptostreptococcus porci]MDD7183122.1 glycerol-3-phosphate 1-O-acyltransferase PlsY [Peptostreptococcus porci]MDY4129598.1 glycerol-3-phosphate 1-O-acyltransferase PlsY [Peptostreptococcus porci]MDY5963563.1 glycerol-3-phosphate 1-O-acyltransferase PlsY [Peptostreptococcus porci]
MIGYISFIVISYLLGNISSSYFISRFVFNTDIRTMGSKNPGTTNAFRVFGKRAGVLTFIGDFLKGTIAVLISTYLANRFNFDANLARYIAAISVVCGHDWPIFLRFKGGKGVATTYGAMLVIAPLQTVASGLFFFISLFTTKYVSLSSMLSIMLFPILMFTVKDLSGLWVCLILSAMVVYRHKSNVLRLINGTEPKAGLGSKKKNTESGEL